MDSTNHRFRTDYHQKPSAHATHQDYPTAWSGTKYELKHRAYEYAKGHKSNQEDDHHKNRLRMNRCGNVASKTL